MLRLFGFPEVTLQAFEGSMIESKEKKKQQTKTQTEWPFKETYKKNSK